MVLIVWIGILPGPFVDRIRPAILPIAARFPDPYAEPAKPAVAAVAETQPSRLVTTPAPHSLSFNPTRGSR
jgi:NADH-quinone oxidoreductase subunit M